MTSEKATKKWKAALLKTSLPLEVVVSEKLSHLHFDVWGEHAYVRANEQNVPTEFSVDISAVGDLDNETCWGTLRLLAECKYNYPGV
ncbi:MAG TPA: hypothetical protein VF771_04460, partial [Longimicrobiaceae bacterium]